MKRELLVGILPDNSNIDDVNIKLSTIDKISVTKTTSSDTYVVYYKLSEFMKLNPIPFITSLSNILQKNMPNDKFNIEFSGYINIDNQKYTRDDVFRLLNINDYINGVSIVNNIIITSTISIVKTATGFILKSSNEDDDKDYDDQDYSRSDQYFSDDDYDDEYDEDEDEESNYRYYNDDDDDDYDEDYDDEDDEYESSETQNTINNILGMGDPNYNAYNNPFEASDIQYKRTFNKKKSYSASRIIKTSKNAKRDIKRHGILIDSGKARDKDEEIIRRFLKDFIPGKANWIKSYRKIMLKRWMAQFVITKKTAKKFEKYNKESKKSNKKVSFKTTSGSKANRGILKYDAFYDTSK